MRQRAGVPDQVRHREKWRQALEMLDEVRDQWELPDLPVVADAGYGDATGFRLGLTERGLAAGRSAARTVTWRQGAKAGPRNPPPTCARASWPCGSVRPTATSPGTWTAPCPSAGCSPSGRPERLSP
jgi:DDE superfamily endonuclease